MGPAPPRWEEERDQLSREVLAFEGLSPLVPTEQEEIKTCLQKMDKTYLLDFLTLFGVTQGNGRTFNRRHVPTSLVSALIEYLDAPGERYMELQQLVTRTERPVRSNRTTAILSESHDPEVEQALDEADVRRPPPQVAPAAIEEPSDDEEEEWGFPDSDRSGSAKKRRASGKILSVTVCKRYIL